MLRRILNSLHFPTSNLKSRDIMQNSYEELVALVAQKYGNPEFKHPNTAVLYEINHQHRVISPGDWILDIGAGPAFRWTDLALYLAQNPEKSHQVVSNDKTAARTPPPNSQFVHGSFLEESVRTRVALTLDSRQFDTILVDISPEFTGELEADGEKMVQVIQEAFYFSTMFLRKGGNFVCKVLKCSFSELLHNKGALFFHETFTFKPSAIRQHSPVEFLIFKGFGANPNLEAIQEFLRRYRGSPKHKTEVLRSYQNKFSWDPIAVLRQKVKNDYMNMRLQGRSERDIISMFQQDPFINIGSIAKNYRQIEKAQMQGDSLAIKKAMHKFSEGQVYKEEAAVPHSREEWITFLETIQEQIKQPSKKRDTLEPLHDNEIYMKDQQNESQQQQQYIYIEQDLTGEYEPTHERDQVQKELAKLNKIIGDNNPQHEQLTPDSTVDLRTVFKQQDHQQTPEQEVEEMADSLRAMSDEQFRAQLEKDSGYKQELQENIGRSVKGSRGKFRNR